MTSDYNLNSLNEAQRDAVCNLSQNSLVICSFEWLLWGYLFKSQGQITKPLTILFQATFMAICKKNEMTQN